eukprot:607149-Amphidinium_carterae.1
MASWSGKHNYNEYAEPAILLRQHQNYFIKDGLRWNVTPAIMGKMLRCQQGTNKGVSCMQAASKQ